MLTVWPVAMEVQLLGLKLVLQQLKEAVERGEATVSEERATQIISCWPMASAAPKPLPAAAGVPPSPAAAAAVAVRTIPPDSWSRLDLLTTTLEVLGHATSARPAVAFIRGVLPDKALSGLGRALAELLRGQRWDPELQQCMLHEIILPQRLVLQDAEEFVLVCLQCEQGQKQEQGHREQDQGQKLRLNQGAFALVKVLLQRIIEHCKAAAVTSAACGIIFGFNNPCHIERFVSNLIEAVETQAATGTSDQISVTGLSPAESDADPQQQHRQLVSTDLRTETRSVTDIDTVLRWLSPHSGDVANGGGSADKTAMERCRRQLIHTHVAATLKCIFQVKPAASSSAASSASSAASSSAASAASSTASSSAASVASSTSSASACAPAPDAASSSAAGAAFPEAIITTASLSSEEFHYLGEDAVGESSFLRLVDVVTEAVASTDPVVGLKALWELKQSCDRAGLQGMQLRFQDSGQRLWEAVVASTAKRSFPWHDFDVEMLDALVLIKPVGQQALSAGLSP